MFLLLFISNLLYTFKFDTCMSSTHAVMFKCTVYTLIKIIPQFIYPYFSHETAIKCFDLIILNFPSFVPDVYRKNSFEIFRLVIF